jgi:translation initiation factor eIF-2B subunit beta
MMKSLFNRDSKGSYWLATHTLDAVGEIVNTAGQWSNVQQLIGLVQNLSDQLNEADPTETVPRNITLRMLKVIRDEFLNWCASDRLTRKSANDSSHVHYDEHLQRLLVHDEHRPPDYSQIVGDLSELRQAVNEAMNELRLELDTSGELIANQALQHVHSDELVLTIGRSRSVEAFLKQAAKSNRRFQVVVAEGAPFNRVGLLRHHIPL